MQQQAVAGGEAPTKNFARYAGADAFAPDAVTGTDINKLLEHTIMDFKERILTAMNHEEPDRVPVMGLIMDPATVNQILEKKPADFVGYHETEPIVIVQPFAKNRPLYSHKALMPAEGSLTIGDTTTGFAKNSSCMIIDDHKGYYPYVMKYDWITALGYDDKGRLIGFNLTDNQVRNHHKYNENCLWLDGKMYPLPPIKITRPSGVEQIWEVRDDYGMVRLYFTPLEDMPVYLNLVLVETRYHGPTGSFEGYIVDPDGNQICFDGFSGMGEKKYIRM